MRRISTRRHLLLMRASLKRLDFREYFDLNQRSGEIIMNALWNRTTTKAVPATKGTKISCQAVFSVEPSPQTEAVRLHNNFEGRVAVISRTLVSDLAKDLKRATREIS